MTLGLPFSSTTLDLPNQDLNSGLFTQGSLFGSKISVSCMTLFINNLMKMHDVISLSPWDFDQDPALGWRSISNPQQRIASIQTYLKRYAMSPQRWKADCQQSKRKVFPYTLIFHLGQLYAMKNDVSKAKRCFEMASKTHDKQWDNYVKATIAFILKDKDAFEKNTSLDNYNKTTIDRLRSNWGHPYSSAY
jgi:hypothetical protein